MPRPATNRGQRTRGRVSGHRDIINVQGTDPAYHYRWVHDKGRQLEQFQEAGYEFCTRDREPGLKVGEAKVGKYQDVGDIFTMPVGRMFPDELMFLMRQPMEYRMEDTQAEERDRRELEKQMFRKYSPDNPGDDGQYGEVKLTRK